MGLGDDPRSLAPHRPQLWSGDARALCGPCPLPCQGMESFCFRIRSTRPRILLLNSFHSTLSVERDRLAVRQQQFRSIGNNSSATSQAFSSRSRSCDHLARHLPRICPREGRSVRAPGCPPPKPRTLRIWATTFRRSPILRTKKTKKCEKSTTWGPTPGATGDPVNFQI